MGLGPGMPLKNVLGKSAEVIGKSGSDFLKSVHEAVCLTVPLEFVEAIKTVVGQSSNLDRKVDSLPSDIPKNKVSVKPLSPVKPSVS